MRSGHADRTDPDRTDPDRTGVHGRRPEVPDRPAGRHGLARPGDRRARPRSPVGLRRALLARHPRPVDGVAAAAAGRRPRARARRLRARPARHGPGARRRHARRPPEPVHAQPRAGVPVRRRPLAVPHRVGRAPHAPAAHPGPARAACPTPSRPSTGHWTESRPAAVDVDAAARAGRAARPHPARAGRGPGRHRTPAPPVAVPPGHGPRRGRWAVERHGRAATA